MAWTRRSTVMLLAAGVMQIACADGRRAAETLADPAYTGARPRADVAGVANFAQVSDALYRGAQPTAEGFRTLQAMGVKTVVDLRDFHSDTAAIRGTTLRLVAIPCSASDISEAEIVRFLRVLNDPANRPVFVHCEYGSDRTGMAVAAYRMVEQGWSATQAAEELPVFGFHELFGNIRGMIAHLDATRVRALVAAGDSPADSVQPAARSVH